MTGDEAARAAMLGLLLTLPLSAMVARRISVGRTARLAGLWVAIFALMLIVVNLTRDGVGQSWTRATALLRDDDQIVSGGGVRVRMAEDGHFWVDATIDGVSRHMLVDSGATTSALSIGTAKAAGLDLDASPFPTIVDTANGKVAAHVASVRQLQVGPITAIGLRVVVSPAFGASDILGMNFLSRLRSWRVEGRTLVLEPATN